MSYLRALSDVWYAKQLLLLWLSLSPGGVVDKYEKAQMVYCRLSVNNAGDERRYCEKLVLVHGDNLCATLRERWINEQIFLLFSI